MSIFSRRKQPRHALSAVQSPVPDTRAEQAAGPAPDYGQDYDDPGWGEDEPRDATSPGFPLPVPPCDDTLLFRVPGLDGGPGFTVPPATLETPDPEDALPARIPGAAIPPVQVPPLRTGPAGPGMLLDLLDALKALPGEADGSEGGAPEPPEITRLRAAMDARPGAWLRAIMPGVTHPWDALPGEPSFAGVIRDPEGLPYAGLYLGEADADGRLVIDIRDPRWLYSLIGAAYQALDALESGEGTEAA